MLGSWPQIWGMEMPEGFPLSTVTIMVIVGQGDARKAAHISDLPEREGRFAPMLETTQKQGSFVHGWCTLRAELKAQPSATGIYRNPGSFATRS